MFSAPNFLSMDLVEPPQISCCDSFFIQLKAYYKFTSIFSFEMCVIWSRIAWYTNENNIKYLSIIDSGSTLLCFGNILLDKISVSCEEF